MKFQVQVTMICLESHITLTKTEQSELQVKEQMLLKLGFTTVYSKLHSQINLT